MTGGNRAQVLYVSYTGLLDPLGQSQVLQYLLGLSLNHDITLLTFEKPDALKDQAKLDDLISQCKSAGIDWHRLAYHNRPGIPATLYDVIIGSMKAVRLARRKRVAVVHCRSYIAGLIGMRVKRKTGARFIFDMRGFWPDERVDGGVWRKDQLRYKVFKRVEKALFQNADHVVSLTRAGVREYEKFDYLRDNPPPSSVIPTCTNLELFQPQQKPSGQFTLGYVGSVGTWYMFDDVAKAVSVLFEKSADARFLVLNKGGHQRIRESLTKAGVDMSRVEITQAPYDQVPAAIARMDAGIFFIKPAWSKRASCPTRMGEFLACGKPCLANAGVGDVEEDLRLTGTGIALPVNSAGELVVDGLGEALDTLQLMTKDPDMIHRCREAAENRFSVAKGIEEYDRIYQRLSGKDTH